MFLAWQTSVLFSNMILVC